MKETKSIIRVYTRCINPQIPSLIGRLISPKVNDVYRMWNVLVNRPFNEKVKISVKKYSSILIVNSNEISQFFQ